MGLGLPFVGPGPIAAPGGRARRLPRSALAAPSLAVACPLCGGSAKCERSCARRSAPDWKLPPRVPPAGGPVLTGPVEDLGELVAPYRAPGAEPPRLVTRPQPKGSREQRI